MTHSSDKTVSRLSWLLEAIHLRVLNLVLSKLCVLLFSGRISKTKCWWRILCWTRSKWNWSRSEGQWREQNTRVSRKGSALRVSAGSPAKSCWLSTIYIPGLKPHYHFLGNDILALFSGGVLPEMFPEVIDTMSYCSLPPSRTTPLRALNNIQKSYVF